MNPSDFEKARTRYLARQTAYKKHGCDPQGESWFILEKSLPLEGRILEVGSGQGYFAMGLAERGFRIVGVDPCADDIAIARWNLEQRNLSALVELQVANGDSLPFPDRSFEEIFSVKVFHHLVAPFKVVDEMIRVLAAEGKIVISDFSEEGFSLVERIHCEIEGEHHPRLGVALVEVKKYLVDKGLGVQHERTRFQETLIAYAA